MNDPLSKKQKKELKRELQPSDEFVGRMKALFLTAYRHKYSVRTKPHFSFVVRYFSRGLALGVAVMAAFSGVASYADYKDVGPTSTLYPFKRSQEFVTMNLITSETERPALHLRYAERRLNEIETLEAVEPSNPRVFNLREAFEREAVRSLAGIELSEEALVQEEIEISVLTGVPIKESEIFPVLPIDSEVVDPGILESPKIDQGSSSQMAIPFSPQQDVVPMRDIDQSGLDTNLLSHKTSDDEGNAPISNIRTQHRGHTICVSWRTMFDKQPMRAQTIRQYNPEFLKKLEVKCNIRVAE